MASLSYNTSPDEIEPLVVARPRRCGMTRWRGVLVVIGGLLIHLSLGTLYCFGNLSPYITSYMRNEGVDTGMTTTKCAWIFAVSTIGLSLLMPLGGMIELRLGPKLTALLGGWCMSLGVLLTFVTIKDSFIATAITYGFVFGMGNGIAYPVPLACVMRWFPERKGLVNGLVLAGFGGGAFIFNQVQTHFINPDNLPAEKRGNDHEKYFYQPSVLKQIPFVFLLIGGCYAAMQFVGSMLLCYPPSDEMEECVNGTSNLQEDEEALIDQRMQKEGEASINMHPLQVIRTKPFYILAFILLFNGQGITFISSLYKAYGETFITDDTFLAIVGSFAAVFNSLGRIFWGSLMDRFSFKTVMLGICAMFTGLMLTLQLSEYGGKPFFFIWICLLFGTFCGNFALMPTAVAKCFGRKYVTINYGLLFLSMLITAPLGVFMTDKLMSSLHYRGMFFLVAGFSFISMILTFLFNARDRNGNEI